MFRHSLATRLLREGAGLEAVGAVLRHRSPDTTAIYAKVDIPMLQKIAQPWPGDLTC
jgi:site-specific recombinase XerD